MKTFILVISLVALNLSFAQQVKPTKCLFTAGAGKKGASSGSSQKDELCSEMNPHGGKRISGVCVFDRVWKRGTWDPTKKGEKRFIVSRICDQGVEYATTPEESLPQGPQFWNPQLVTINKNNHTSNLQADDGRLTGKVPASCFTQNDPTTFASAAARTCSSDILAVDFCELKNLSNYSANSKKLSGNWWVQYIDPTKRTFRICVGGVTLVDATVNDPVYAKIANTSPLAEGDARVCIRTISGKKSELACAPEGKANSCVNYADISALNAWKKEVFEYIKENLPDEVPDFSDKIGKAKIVTPSLAKLRRWDPEDPEHKKFLFEANERLNNSKKWYQILKIAKDGTWSTDNIASCDEVIVARPRN